MPRVRIAIAVLAVLLFGAVTHAEDAIHVGVLAKRGAKKCLAKWGPTGEYLSEKLGRKVVILPLKFTQIEPAVKEKRVDFVLANSAFFVELRKKHGVEAVASLVNSRQGKALRQFGGVVLVKKDSPIRKLADIRGKTFMCVKYSSFGGGHMAWRLLLDSGIDPKKDCARFLEGGKHDNVVLAVRAGAVDAGTVRSDTLERMAAEGKIKLDEFRILHRVEDDFPFVHSTRLYPEWPMASCAHTDKALAAKVAEALTALSKDAPAAKAAKCVGWCAPLDYGPVVECLEAIGYGAFAAN
jgi:two-component system sensor histidine kinase TtrS